MRNLDFGIWIEKTMISGALDFGLRIEERNLNIREVLPRYDSPYIQGGRTVWIIVFFALDPRLRLAAFLPGIFPS